MDDPEKVPFRPCETLSCFPFFRVKRQCYFRPDDRDQRGRSATGGGRKEAYGRYVREAIWLLMARQPGTDSGRAVAAGCTMYQSLAVHRKRDGGRRATLRAIRPGKVIGHLTAEKGRLRSVSQSSARRRVLGGRRNEEKAAPVFQAPQQKTKKK